MASALERRWSPSERASSGEAPDAVDGEHDPSPAAAVVVLRTVEARAADRRQAVKARHPAGAARNQPGDAA